MNNVTRITVLAGHNVAVYYPKNEKCEGCPYLTRGEWGPRLTGYTYGCSRGPNASTECEIWYAQSLRGAL